MAARHPVARRLLAALPPLALVAGVVGCGLSTDDEPQAIPNGTADPDTTTTTTTRPAPVGETDNVTVYFLQSVEGAEEVLYEAQRQVPLPATPATRLDALFTQPPTDEEREEGVWSAIPVDAVLADRPRQEGTVLVVDLPEGVYDQLHGVIAQDAFAQIVFTATAIPGVSAVAFQRDGSPFEAVDGSGQAQRGPLSRADFPELDPEAAAGREGREAREEGRDEGRQAGADGDEAVPGAAVPPAGDALVS